MSLARPLEGRTVRWRFDDGPVAGRTFEHTLHEDGSITFRGEGEGAEGTTVQPEHAAFETIAPGVHVVSYLAAPYALTVVLNETDGSALAFASSGDTWARQRGTFEVLPRAGGTRPLSERMPPAGP